MNIRQLEEMNGLETWYWWYCGRRRVAQTLYRRYFGTTRGDKRYLDIGCATGETATILAAGANIIGIDENQEALHLAKEKGYREVVAGSAVHLPFADASYQGAFMLDVLEHIVDDRKALAEVCRVLEPGAKVLFTMPAYQWLWSGYDESVSHKRRYGKRELLQKIRDAGFTVLYASHYVTVLFPLVAAYRLIGRWFGSTCGVNSVPIPGFVNALLRTTLYFEAWLIGYGIRLPFGVSLVVVAEKR